MTYLRFDYFSHPYSTHEAFNTSSKHTLQAFYTIATSVVCAWLSSRLFCVCVREHVLQFIAAMNFSVFGWAVCVCVCQLRDINSPCRQPVQTDVGLQLCMDHTQNLPLTAVKTYACMHTHIHTALLVTDCLLLSFISTFNNIGAPKTAIYADVHNYLLFHIQYRKMGVQCQCVRVCAHACLCVCACACAHVIKFDILFEESCVFKTVSIIQHVISAPCSKYPCFSIT